MIITSLYGFISSSTKRRRPLLAFLWLHLAALQDLSFVHQGLNPGLLQQKHSVLSTGFPGNSQILLVLQNSFLCK